MKKLRFKFSFVFLTVIFFAFTLSACAADTKPNQAEISSETAARKIETEKECVMRDFNDTESKILDGFIKTYKDDFKMDTAIEAGTAEYYNSAVCLYPELLDFLKYSGHKKPAAALKTNAGWVYVELYSDIAPNHTANFLSLVKSGFYDGITFHRVIKNFVVQAGCPNTKSGKTPHLEGTGGPGYNIKSEFNPQKHKAGILSMARAQHPHSGGSQFFICLGNLPMLDNQYTVFGNVIKGMDAVRKIEAAQTDQRDRPLETFKIEKGFIISDWQEGAYEVEKHN